MVDIPQENLLSTPAGYATPTQIASLYDYAKALQTGGQQFPTVGHWTQGLSNVVNALMGGAASRQADLLQQQSLQQFKKQTGDQLPNQPGTTGAPVSAPTDKGPAARAGALSFSQESGGLPPGATDLTKQRNAITGIESGGNYGLVGPAVKHKDGTVDHAYGRYQVMGENIPQWTREVLGRSMTPQEFVADRAAQDAVFNAKFGEYRRKYGDEGAAKAWFAGEKGMNNPNARDVLGTTVQGYADRFARALGAPSQTASAQAGPMPFQGAEGGSVADKANAITSLAFNRNAPQAPAPVPGFNPNIRNAPIAGAPNTPVVPSWAVPPIARPSKESSVGVMTNPLFSTPGLSELALKSYMGQFQPIQVPWTGGNVLVNPNDSRQQTFRPDLIKTPIKLQGGGGTGAETEQFSTVTPTPGGGLQQNIIPTQIPGMPPGMPPGGATGGPGVAIPPPPAPGSQNAPAAPAGPAAGLPNLLHYAPEEGATGGVPQAQPTVPQNLPPFAPNAQAKPPEGPQSAQYVPPYLKGMLGEMSEFGLEREGRQKEIDQRTQQYAKTYQDLAKAGQVATRSIPSIQLAKELTNDPTFISGFLAPLRTDVAKAKAFLSDYIKTNPNAAAATEMFDKLMSGNIVEDMKVMLQGLGQVRVAEIDLLSRATANKYNTVPSNRAVLDIMLRTHQMASNLSQMAAAYANGVRWDPKTGAAYQALNHPTGLDYGWDSVAQKYMMNHPLFSPEEIKNYNHTFDLDKAAAPSEGAKKYGGQEGIKKTLEAAQGGGAPAQQPTQPAGDLKSKSTDDLKKLFQ